MCDTFEVITVNEFLTVLTTLKNAGKGNMKIKCKDNYLHKDEISIDYKNNEILLHGYLFNTSISNKVVEFRRDIECAIDKFYNGIDEN